MTDFLSFIEQIRTSIASNAFIKLSLGNYKGGEKDLRQVIVKPVLIKREVKLSFTFRYHTKDITKNYVLQEGLSRIQELLHVQEFRVAVLFTPEQNLICQSSNKGNWSLRVEKATSISAPSLSHDKQKERKIEKDAKVYLHELRLTDEKGNVYKNAQDKWKQINHYVEILSSSLDSLSRKKTLRVVDMGAGKGYLTFALYDYMKNTLGLAVEVEGVEYRDDLVKLCNSIAENADFKGLHFSQGTIEDYSPATKIDMLIALHACDTATDDAIYKGIHHQAEIIVVAPCCHKQVRRELERVKADNHMNMMTRHGIFMERHAEMLTDSIRALILEYFGYYTKVIQFIADAHTPKNVMIIGVKKDVTADRQQSILTQLKETKTYFGLDFHYLERLLGLE